MNVDQVVANIEIDGRAFDVFISANAEEFYASFDGEEIRASSKRALQERLKGLLRTRGIVVVPVTTFSTDYDDIQQVHENAAKTATKDK